MKISYNWLKSILDFDLSPENIEAILTATGLEVENYEKVESVKGGLRGLVAGEVVTCEPHPNADKLKICQVDIGASEMLSIVCGAPNVEQGLKVIVAQVGTTIYPLEGEPFTIQKAKIRGESSQGMLCAEDEIGLGKSHAGLYLLPQDIQKGSAIADYFKVESDVVFEIGLTANRGDAASHLGVARELATVLKQTIRLSIPEFPESKGTEKMQVEVEDPQNCPRYCGVVLEHIHVQDSPEWLKNRLSSIGLKPINNIIDIGNYVLHTLGQPLHVFDFDKIKNQHLHIRQAKNGEQILTLDGVNRTLKGEELVIADESQVLCLAGVYGGLDSGVSANTKRIFIESAYFSPDKVRKTAKIHGLNTDASFRFERGCDPEICLSALQLAVSLIGEIAEGKLCSEVYDLYPQKILPFSVKLRKQKIKQVLGIEIPEERIEQILKGLGIQILSHDENAYQLSVPSFKSDVSREIDVIEELIRIYGFAHVPLEANVKMSLNYKKHKPYRRTEQRISEILSANGFREMMNNSLSADKYYSEKEALVYISNPLSQDLNIMRQSMVYGALETIAYNKNRKQSNNRFYEFGKIYGHKESGFKETDQLLIIASGNKTNDSWEQKAEQVDRAYIQTVCNKVQDAFKTRLKYQVEQVDSSILARFGIKEPVYYTCIDWSKLMQSEKEFQLKPVPLFPVVKRDLSLVLSQSVPFESVQHIIDKKGSHKIKSCYVFDVYKGKPLEEGQKSLSISFELYDEEKTMNEADIDPIMNKLVQAFETELHAIIRK